MIRCITTEMNIPARQYPQLGRQLRILDLYSHELRVQLLDLGLKLPDPLPRLAPSLWLARRR